MCSTQPHVVIGYGLDIKLYYIVYNCRMVWSHWILPWMKQLRICCKAGAAAAPKSPLAKHRPG